MLTKAHTYLFSRQEIKLDNILFFSHLHYDGINECSLDFTFLKGTFTKKYVCAYIYTHLYLRTIVKVLKAGVYSFAHPLPPTTLIERFLILLKKNQNNQKDSIALAVTLVFQ